MELLVPVMVGIYIFACLGVLWTHKESLGSSFSLIFQGAFSGTAATGGFLGAGFREVLTHGIRRSVFSNGAGMGDGALAHASAKAEPLQQGIIAMLNPLIDTIILCTLTALVILVTGAWTQHSGIQGVVLTVGAFEGVYGQAGGWVIFICILLFSASTIISYEFYGEQGAVFLFGPRVIMMYRIFFLGFLLAGPFLMLKVVINITDALYGLLAFPNLFANLMLVRRIRPLLSHKIRGNNKVAGQAKSLIQPQSS